MRRTLYNDRTEKIMHSKFHLIAEAEQLGFSMIWSYIIKKRDYHRMKLDLNEL